MSEAGDPNRKIFNMYFTQWWSVVNTLSQLNELEVILDLNYFKSCLLNEIFMQNDAKCGFSTKKMIKVANINYEII